MVRISSDTLAPKGKTSMTDKKTHRAFDIALKLQVVKMIRQQSLSIGQVCKDMNLVDSAVRRWLMQFDAKMAGRSGIGKPLTTEQPTHPCLRCCDDRLNAPK